jgi:hypothetical protein
MEDRHKQRRMLNIQQFTTRTKPARLSVRLVQEQVPLQQNLFSPFLFFYYRYAPPG